MAASSSAGTRSSPQEAALEVGGGWKVRAELTLTAGHTVHSLGVHVHGHQQPRSVCVKTEHPQPRSGLSILQLCRPLMFTAAVGPVCLHGQDGGQSGLSSSLAAHIDWIKTTMAPRGMIRILALSHNSVIIVLVVVITSTGRTREQRPDVLGVYKISSFIHSDRPVWQNTARDDRYFLYNGEAHLCDLDIDCNAREVLGVGRLKQNVRCGFNAEEHKARSD